MPKKRNFTRPVRDELSELCDNIKKLSESMKTNPEKISILQGGVQTLMNGLDELTREYVYDQVETVLLAESDAAKCLVSQQILETFEKFQDSIYAGIKTKKVVEAFIDGASNIFPPMKEEVYRAIILRLMMELSSKTLQDLLNRTGPATLCDKERDQSRHMYG